MKLFSPAKINLYLHILGKRDDGFHELETFMAAVSWGDDIFFEKKEKGIELSSSCPELPCDASNLVHRAAILFFRRYNIEGGASLRIEKRIPMGAGLGGGSSNAATTLLGLSQLYDLPSSEGTLDELASLAAELGSDVPFFIYQKPAVCSGRGEKIKMVSLKESLQGVLLYPRFSVSTPWAYQAYAAESPPPRGKEGVEISIGRLRNDLEPPVFKKHLWLPTAKEWLKEQDQVMDSMMSGSGSTLFALLEKGQSPEGLLQKINREFGENILSVPFEILQ